MNSAAPAMITKISLGEKTIPPSSRAVGDGHGEEHGAEVNKGAGKDAKHDQV